MALNRFHWFWMGLLFVTVVCALVFFKTNAAAQCADDDLICITMP